jgi:hypothetical protein
MQRDGLLVPPLAVADYSEERVGSEDDKYTDKGDDLRIAESRPIICRKFSSSILFGESADNL